MSHSILYPVQLLHKARWQLGSMVRHKPNAGENVRIRNNTAAFFFVASKTGVLLAQACAACVFITAHPCARRSFLGCGDAIDL